MTEGNAAAGGRNTIAVAMLHDIPARSRLLPTIPITSPRFVYRRAGETDVQVTFARARAALRATAAQPPSVPGMGAAAPKASPTIAETEPIDRV